MNMNFHPELRLRIFDRFATFGCRALLSFGLVILAMKQDDLEKKKTGDLFPILQKPDACEEMKGWRQLFQKYDKMWISERDYEKFFRKAGVPLFI
jgi:hypothetical protein